MFDIGWSELVVIAVVALIAIGPKELPGVLRTVGNYMGKIRRMASEFQGQFQEAMREAEMADLKKSVDEMTDVAKSYTDFDPLASVKSEVESFAADPLGEANAAQSAKSTSPESASPESAAPESASPEAAAPAMPAPVSSDAELVPPESRVAIAPEAPQPAPEQKNTTATGSGA